MIANATQDNRELCLGAGMDDYRSKPIRVEVVTRVDVGGEYSIIEVSREA